MNTPCAASFEKISKVQNWQIECQHAGFTPEKTLQASQILRWRMAKPPALALRCAVFATPTAATIIDQHDFNSDILPIIEEAEK